jgi:hypothetical protein
VIVSAENADLKLFLRANRIWHAGLPQLLIGKFAREFPRIGANEILSEPSGTNLFFATLASLVAQFQKTGIFRRALDRISIRAYWRRFAGKTP